MCVYVCVCTVATKSTLGEVPTLIAIITYQCLFASHSSSIQAEFQVPMFTSSGVQVRFLKVYDKSGYLTKRWVRYITRAGHYQIRI